MDARGSTLYGIESSAFGQLSAPKEVENPNEDFGKKLIADFYRENVPRLLADAGFRAALNPLREFQKEHLRRAEKGQGRRSGLVSECRKEQKDPSELLEGLMNIAPFLAALAVGKNARKRDWESLWTFGTGKTWKSLREFPRRLRSMADEVERLNKSHLFSPERAITKKTPHANFAKTQFARLPACLNLYASWIEMWASKIPSLTGEHSRRQRGRGDYVYGLSVIIAILTGRFHDEKVSDLLNAADLALNPESQQRAPRFHPQTLADLRSRQKRKRPKT
jgi:hypothetical protein